MFVQIIKCICLDCEEANVNVNSEDRVNASTIHGISSPRLCSEECRCKWDQNKQNQQLLHEQICAAKVAKSATIQKQNCETKLAKLVTITIITGPEFGATTGFGTERLHPGVASAFSMHVDLLQHLC